MIAYETRLGNIVLSEAYLSKLIGHEVTSCFGVVGMAPRSHTQRLSSKFLKEQPIDTGIKVTGTDNNITVELHIIVIYGMNINAIAASITEKVKYAVKETVGLNVEKVIVKVDGIKEE